MASVHDIFDPLDAVGETTLGRIESKRDALRKPRPVVIRNRLAAVEPLVLHSPRREAGS